MSKSIMSTIIIFIILTSSTSITHAIESKSSLFQSVEKQFIIDIGNEVHIKEKGQYANSLNKCDYSIGNIAMAFSKMESGIGEKGMSIPTKNWTSLHPSSRSVFYMKWDGKSTMSTGETLRSYGKVEDGIYDFMYLFKYFYRCNVSYKMILTYIYGFGEKTTKQHSHARLYYNNLIHFINKYENTPNHRSIDNFNKVGIDFKKDMGKNYLKFPKSTFENKCQYDIAKIAYAFHIVSNQREDVIKNTRNLFGISKFRTKIKSIGINKNGIAEYASESDSIYDFMYAFKYENNCIVKKDSIKQWFYGEYSIDEVTLINKTDEIKNILSNE